MLGVTQVQDAAFRNEAQWRNDRRHSLQRRRCRAGCKPTTDKLCGFRRRVQPCSGRVPWHRAQRELDAVLALSPSSARARCSPLKSGLSFLIGGGEQGAKPLGSGTRRPLRLREFFRDGAEYFRRRSPRIAQSIFESDSFHPCGADVVGKHHPTVILCIDRHAIRKAVALRKTTPDFNVRSCSKYVPHATTTESPSTAASSAWAMVGASPGT